MFIRFLVSNFLSFDEETEFNMLPGAYKTHKHHVYKAGKIDLLKAAAIYGANGAGKSNLILAIDALKGLVEIGKIDFSANKNKFKLNRINAAKPITFEIEFSIGKKIFSYGISFNHQHVQEEWLYQTNLLSESRLIFERKQNKSGKSLVKFSDKNSNTDKSKLLIQLLEENLLKHDELIFSKTDILKIKEISDAKSWIKSLVILFPGFKYNELTKSIYKDEHFRHFANELLNSFDTGITSLDFESTELDKFLSEDDETLRTQIITMLDEGKELHFPLDDDSDVVMIRENGKNIVKRTISKHTSNDGNEIIFELNEESDGTKRLLDFIPAFDTILNHEVTFIIDEIDQSLHPVLLQKLIKKIMADENTKGQLIFTTHESNLLDLDIFRQDEIWFAEKDKKKGSTQLYSLSEFKPRYDLDIRKGYLKGRFGAIPFLAHLEDLKWLHYDA